MDGCCEAPCQREAELPAGLTQREASVLCELARGDDAQLGFSGLKRRLGIHPEQLSRTLHRLEREGLVSRGVHGWGLTEKAYGLLEGCSVTPPRGPSVSLAHLLLPTHVTGPRIANALAHRWFRGLRWYGFSDGPGETVLLWQTEHDGVPVRLRIGSGSAQLEVPEEAAARDEVLASAGALLPALYELFSPRGRAHGPAQGVQETPEDAAEAEPRTSGPFAS